MFKRILVPVDLADPGVARKAIDVARRIAEMDGAEVLLISVTGDPRDPAEEARLEAELQAIIDAEKDGVAMDGILNFGGSIATQVRHAAEEFGCDLVVMASHWPRLDDRLFGSRSASVALHSACSVLVVR